MCIRDSSISFCRASISRRDKFSPCWARRGIKREIIPKSIETRTKIVTEADNKFPSLNLDFKKMTIGRPIREITAAIAMYSSKDCNLNNKYSSKAMIDTLNKLNKMLLEISLLFI